MFIGRRRHEHKKLHALGGDVGDLVIKVCSDILQVPIIVVTSIVGSPYVPFMPDDAVINNPIYLAYQAFGPGHYNGTVQAADKNITGTVRHEPFCLFYSNLQQKFRECLHIPATVQ